MQKIKFNDVYSLLVPYAVRIAVDLSGKITTSFGKGIFNNKDLEAFASGEEEITTSRGKYYRVKSNNTEEKLYIDSDKKWMHSPRIFNVLLAYSSRRESEIRAIADFS